MSRSGVTEEDARIKHVVLTEAGRTLLAEAVGRWQVTNDAVKACVTSTDLSSLYSGLGAIAEIRQ